MLNNPENLSAQEFLEQAQEPEDCCYVIFAAVDRRRTGLYYVLHRVVWNRGSAELMEDHAWHFSEAPEKIQ